MILPCSGTVVVLCPFWLQFIIQQVGNYEDYMYILKMPSKPFSHEGWLQSWQNTMVRSCVLGPTFAWWIWTAWVRACDCTHMNVTHFELLSPGSLLGFCHHEMTGGFQAWSFKGLQDSNIVSCDFSILLQLLPQFFSWEIPESVPGCQVVGGSWEGKKKSR